jgi:hypothetical protein
MSRRIVFAIPAIISVLISAPAHADRECFENSCRTPEAVDPSPQTAPAPTGPVKVESPRAVTPEAVSPEVVPPRGPARRDVAPRNASEQRPAKARSAPTSTPSSTDRRKPDAAPDAATSAAPISARRRAREVPSPRMMDQPPPGALPPRRVDVDPRLPARPRYSARPHGPVMDAPLRKRARPIIVSAPYGVIGPVPRTYPDPSWRPCQLNEQGVVLRYDRCGPHSYYPYGVHGYRPMGSYGAYRGEPVYVVLPDARIIVVDPLD